MKKKNLIMRVLSTLIVVTMLLAGCGKQTATTEVAPADEAKKEPVVEVVKEEPVVQETVKPTPVVEEVKEEPIVEETAEPEQTVEEWITETAKQTPEISLIVWNEETNDRKVLGVNEEYQISKGDQFALVINGKFAKCSMIPEEIITEEPDYENGINKITFDYSKAGDSIKFSTLSQRDDGMQCYTNNNLIPPQE